MSRITGCLLAATLACACHAAWANRPLTTDTADTIGHGVCQFEPYAGRNASSGSPDEHFWTLQLNCGVTDHTQLGASAGRAWAAGAADQALAVAGKTALVTLKDGQTGFAVAYGLSASRPSGASWSGEGVFVNGIASRELREGLLVHGNVGWSHSRSAGQSSTTYAIATEYTSTPRLVLSAELYGDDRGSPWVGAGVWFSVADKLSVNASYGVQTSSPRVRQLTLGFLVEF